MPINASVGAQLETALTMYARELRARGGSMVHVSWRTYRQARRLLRLNAGTGYSVNLDAMDRQLESLGIDPVTLKLIDHDLFEQKIYAIKQRKRKIKY
jgi:hypothetical protein